ncbi:DUF4255 domain-containing protein [bacterium]|nr:MAG: DUF4255 domain-containing protein [bacterium]
MFTALRATSLTLARFLQAQFEEEPSLGTLFGAGGGMKVSLNTPQEMVDEGTEGVSVWLYRIERDADRLNLPRERPSPNEVRRPALPLRLHYLITPITKAQTDAGPETEQALLGKTLQVFHDHPVLGPVDMRDDFRGTGRQIAMRLESLGQDEISRIWDALGGSYQLSVSYEASLVTIDSALVPETIAPVTVAVPEYLVRAQP